MTAAGVARMPGLSASGRLRTLLGTLGGDTVSVGEVTEALGQGGHGALLLLGGVAALIPGVAPLFGVALLVAGLGLLTGGGTVRLPAMLRDRRLERATLDDALRRVAPRLDWLQAKLPGGGEVLPGALVRAAGAAAILNAALIVLPIPFGNTAPAVATLVLALGLIAGNSRAVWTALAATAAAAAIDGTVLAIASGAILGLFGLI